MDKVLNQIYNIHQSLISSYPEITFFCGTDVNNQIYVYYDNLDLLYKKKYLFYLTGRGNDYKEAYIDLCRQMMDKSYMLRYKTKFYATRNIRNIIKRNKILENEGDEFV